MDTVINAWDNILYRSFPRHTTHRGGDFYTLPLHRHAGAWGDGWGRSIVVELLVPDWDYKPGVGHGGIPRPPPAETTDVAWVELAAPNKAKSRAAWRDLMQIAVDRLAEVNAERRLLLILVAGFRWMPFMWDPVEPLVSGRGPLLMKGDGEDERWPVDPRVSMVLREGEVELSSRLTFDPLEAYTLDYWTRDESGAVPNLKNLLWLEKLLAGARPETLAVMEESQLSAADE
jgi:hypothetical protein